MCVCCGEIAVQASGCCTCRWASAAVQPRSQSMDMSKVHAARVDSGRRDQSRDQHHALGPNMMQPSRLAVLQ